MACKVAIAEKNVGQQFEMSTTTIAEVEAIASTDPIEHLTLSKNEGGGRKRKRHLFNAIRGQIEFYFGDANLSKDRFLRRYVEQDPYVPLEIFLTFNKIKALTQDVHQISTSLSNSQILELDESGLKVRRKTAMPEHRDVSKKTLYVEALPTTATHDWLKEVFGRYGPVSYVSLPHYSGTRKIKGFAFIEFEKTCSVEKALKAYSQIQGVLSVEHTDPSDLATIRSFQQQQQKQKNKISSDRHEGSSETNVKQPSKHEADKEGVLEAVTAKRGRLDTVKCEASVAEITETENSQQSGSDSNNEEKNKATKQKRRRKQKKRILADKLKPNIEPSALELKILPKTSWCRLRNKYLNLQRRLVSESKTKLWRSSQTQQPKHKCTTMQLHLQAQQQQLAESKGVCPSGHDEQKTISDPEDVSEVPVPAKRRKRNKNAGVHKMNMNFYGAGGSETEETKLAGRAEDAAQERSPLFKYEPGLIVECTLHEPCVNVKDFKADIRQYAGIKYVDIKEGEQVAHLRMVTPNAAEQLVRHLSCAEMQLKVLRGQHETLYWRKIEQDREAKLSKKVRVQQKRGREKVTKMFAKHIKFDDADDETINDAVTAASIPSN